MDITSIVVSVTTIAKNIIDLTKQAKAALSGDKKAEEMLSKVQGEVSELLTGLLTLQSEALNLQAENSRLQEMLSAQAKKGAEQDRYEAKKKGDYMVVVLRGEEGPPYWCHSCFLRNDYVQLSGLPMAMRRLQFGNLMCPKCESRYQI